MTSSTYLIPVNAHPVDVPTPVSARYPNARTVTADARPGEWVVVCDGCMGTVKAIYTVGDTRIVGVVHEDKNDHHIHWFAVPLEPAPAVTRFSHMRQSVTVPDGRVGRIESIQTTDSKVIFGIAVGIEVVRVEVETDTPQ